MNCWICGNVADSREHRIKASDIALHIGSVSPENPLFMRGNNFIQKRIHSKRSRLFQYKKTICSDCNSNRTQRYDKSWETLSKYFYEKDSYLKRVNRWSPARVFRGCSVRKMKEVQLFFIKNFGCFCVDQAVPLDLKNLAQSLINGEPNRNFYLRFSRLKSVSQNQKSALMTPLNVLEHKQTREIPVAFTHYVVGSLVVEQFYLINPNWRKHLKALWSPFDKQKSYLLYKEL